MSHNYKHTQHPTESFSQLRIEALERENRSLREQLNNHVKENR